MERALQETNAFAAKELSVKKPAPTDAYNAIVTKAVLGHYQPALPAHDAAARENVPRHEKHGSEASAPRPAQ